MAAPGSYSPHDSLLVHHLKQQQQQWLVSDMDGFDRSTEEENSCLKVMALDSPDSFYGNQSCYEYGTANTRFTLHTKGLPTIYCKAHRRCRGEAG